MRFTWPNLLTLLRIALIPVFMLVFLLPYAWAPPVSCAIFALAGITDWLDGYLARRFNETSAFGRFLDPVADKLMVTTALVLLLSYDPRLWLTISVIIIIGREITISALREWMAELGVGKHIAVSFVAKVKTTVQMLAIGLMLFQYPLLGAPIYEIGVLLLFVAAGLTLWSMTLYLLAAWPDLSRDA
ncbi:MAG TPA: CDP-diacylglycerol--glycerol-3-phosphate 3-phosphatidyltransferase [Gammaproteobacteria bacterium]|nr:CDP-diacylglycerol--glycerol-3-phosphate 3-phosphatidyltransferase [Gammaproteobacteria bacterium]